MNLPNRITVLRLILIPVFVAFFFIEAIPFNYLIALGIFALAAFTDFLDGYIARKYDMITNLGKFLDPIADKILVCTALILLLTKETVMPGLLGSVCLTIVIAREFTVSAFRIIAASKDVIMAADMAGKIKTVVQFFAVFVLLFACQFTEYGFFIYIKWAGLALLLISTALCVISGANYIIKNIDVLKD